MPPETGQLWAVVLAGGEGRRLAPLTRELYGEDRPKQYAALIGGRSLLAQTLGRVGLLIPPRRTVVVTMASHARYLASELRGFPEVHVLAQPSDRGTAAAVFLAALWVHARDADARVVVCPAGQFVTGDAAFMGHVADASDYVRRAPQWLVVLGAAPATPEAEYGWIERGKCVGVTARGPIHRVHRFRERPRPDFAQVLLASGALWNTLVFAAGAATLVEAARGCVPEVHDALANGRGTVDEAYRRARFAEFSPAVLDSLTRPLAVAEMSGVLWSDLGTPQRVADVLRILGAWREGRGTAANPSRGAGRC